MPKGLHPEDLAAMARAQTEPKGDCFRWATKNASGDDIVAHGKVTNPLTGRTFDHAWIERGDKIYDDHAPEGYSASVLDILKAKDVVRYPWDRAAVLTIRTGHFGPYTPEEQSLVKPSGPKPVGRAIETGARGGRYYVSPTGSKVYVKSNPGAETVGQMSGQRFVGGLPMSCHIAEPRRR